MLYNGIQSTDLFEIEFQDWDHFYLRTHSDSTSSILGLYDLEIKIVKAPHKHSFTLLAWGQDHDKIAALDPAVSQNYIFEIGSRA